MDVEGAEMTRTREEFLKFISDNLFVLHLGQANQVYDYLTPEAAGPRAEVSKITVTLAEEVLKEINNELDMAVNQEAFLLRRCYLNGTVKQLAEAVLSQPPAPKPVAVSDEVDSEE